RVDCRIPRRTGHGRRFDATRKVGQTRISLSCSRDERQGGDGLGRLIKALIYRDIFQRFDELVSHCGAFGMVGRRAFLKLLVPRWVKSYHQRRWHQNALRKSWLSRPSTAIDDHVAVYWNSGEQPNRQQLTDILCRELQNGGDVLEYGRHVGLNIKLLNDTLRD